MTERSVTLEITGMHCAACAQSVEKALRRVAGVAEANVNFAAETARVTFDPTQTSTKQLIAVVQDTGYTAEATGEQPLDEQEQARTAESRRRSAKSDDCRRRDGGLLSVRGVQFAAPTPLFADR